VDPVLAPSVRASPGLRVPGAVDGPEILLRALLGQQVSVAAARSAATRLTMQVDDRLPEPDGELTHLFPAPAAIAALPSVAGPRRRAQTKGRVVPSMITG
jgi:AraC family transcriptional regulator of adaptative response / DNA-3-methyladenine glycosylase II